jgi:lysophospholipase L1-like esterase
MSHADPETSRSGLLSILDAVWPTWAASTIDHPGFWEWQIRLYERNDRRSTPLREGILFTGSSSINLWGSLAEDMAPLRVLNRGFGGAHLDHVNRYAGRIVLPYRPRLIVLYAGENDLSGWSEKTPETVTADFRHFVEIVHDALPQTKILYLSIKPSLLRAGLAGTQHETNERIARIVDEDERLGYVDMASPLLDEGGEPRPELFRWDRLHLNEEGYRLWAAHLRPRLEEEWRKLAPPAEA